MIGTPSASIVSDAIASCGRRACTRRTIRRQPSSIDFTVTSNSPTTLVATWNQISQSGEASPRSESV